MPFHRLLKIVCKSIAVFLLAATLPCTAAFSQVTCPVQLNTQDAVSQQASSILSGLIRDAHSPRLEAFYQPCGFALAWTHNGQTTPQARSIMNLLDRLAEKGLRPGDYGSPRWGARACALDIQCDETTRELAQFDFDLTSAVTLLIADLMTGRTTLPGQRAAGSVPPTPSMLAATVWESAVTAPDVPSAVQQLEPSAPGYLRTEAALSRYLALALQGPDVAVPANIVSSTPGAPALAALRLRLQQLGDLPPAGASDTEDAPLREALQRFQSRHGLALTGVVDARTLRQLNVPIAQRIEQLNLTLERWRWVPHSFQEPPVVVNIPEFRVRAYDEHLNVVLSMPVIVGRAEHRKTPVLQAEMTQIIFHPYWNVPRDIQDRELIPHIARSQGYLATNDYEAIDGRGNVVRPEAMTISGLKSGAIRIRQKPGEKNALGSIKFVFPNNYDVYMHGTPQMSLFQQDRRAFSHGCIRLEDPVAMATWVLRKQDGWSKERIEAGVADPHTITVPLTHAIPVLVVYGTGFAAEDETLRFFDDVYGYDVTLERALDELSRSRLKTQH